MTPHTSCSFNPQFRPNKLFSGNTAHSSGYDWDRGSCIYVGGKLWHTGSGPNAPLRYKSGREARDTYDDDGTIVPMEFDNIKVGHRPARV